MIDTNILMSSYLTLPAMFEGLAEEAVELAHAAQKLARYYRGESPVGEDKETMVNNLTTEYTHLLLYIYELGIFPNNVKAREANERFEKRLRESGVIQ